MAGHLLLREEREKGEGLPLHLVVAGLFVNLDLLRFGKVKRPQKASFCPFFLMLLPTLFSQNCIFFLLFQSFTSDVQQCLNFSPKYSEKSMAYCLNNSCGCFHFSPLRLGKTCRFGLLINYARYIWKIHRKRKKIFYAYVFFCFSLQVGLVGCLDVRFSLPVMVIEAETLRNKQES